MPERLIMGKQCCHFFSAIVDQNRFRFVSMFCLFCAFTSPRYQVNVYKTIGPLVFICLEISSILELPFFFNYSSYVFFVSYAFFIFSEWGKLPVTASIILTF